MTDRRLRRTFVLSLPYRADRRREMGEVLCRAQLDWVPGKVELFEATRVGSARLFLSIGMHGCFLSHLRMLREGRLGVSRLLMMEDDREISLRFVEVENAVAQWLAADDWGLAYLGHDGPTGLEPGAAAGMVRVANRSVTN